MMIFFVSGRHDLRFLWRVEDSWSALDTKYSKTHISANQLEHDEDNPFWIWIEWNKGHYWYNGINYVYACLLDDIVWKRCDNKQVFPQSTLKTSPDRDLLFWAVVHIMTILMAVVRCKVPFVALLCVSYSNSGTVCFIIRRSPSFYFRV